MPSLLETLASGLLNYSRSEPEGLLARGLRQPAGLLGRGLNSLDRGLAYTPPTGLLADQQRLFAPSVMDTPEERGLLGRRVVQNTVSGPLGLAPIGWTAYHGSPHKFDKFSMDKIGTGEGAQAYGHGLYFADNPQVAKEYGFANRGRGAASAGLIDELPKPVQMDVFKVMNKRDGPIRDAMYQDLIQKNPQDADKIRAVFNDKSGTLYKVDISDTRAPKEAFLDWDKPLSQQPKAMDVARQVFNDPRRKQAGFPALSDEQIAQMSVADLYQAMSAQWRGGQKGASADLAKAGFPGIRYLDGGSRGAGNGTYNTVLFDDSLVKILGRE